MFFTQVIDHLRKVIQILFQRGPFRRNINIVEAVIRHIQLVEEFKRDIRFALRQLQCFAGLLPRTVKRTDAEHIRTVPAEGVPVAGSKTQVIFHALTQHQLVRIVMTKCERISGFRAFVTNTIELVEISLHI
ncbi:hypothetical protein D3C80_1422030 [compost metagenome]